MFYHVTNTLTHYPRRMVDTKTKQVAKAGAAGKTKKPHAPRNFKLPGGVWRYSRSTMYSRRRLYKVKKATTPKEKPKRKPRTVVKPIGGDKNGGFRVVKVKKQVSFFFPAISIHKLY